MKFITTLITVFGLALSNLALAQSVILSNIYDSDEFDEANGLIPKNMKTLVGSAEVIVRGRFGEFLENELSYGYGYSRESLQRERDLSDSELDRIAIPVSKYEIIVEEVLLGEIEGKVIEYSIFELNPTDRKFTHPEFERLFFLGRNPDGTYSPLGASSVIKISNGSYSFDSLTEFPGAIENQKFEFALDISAEEFEGQLEQEIMVERLRREN